MDIIYTERDLPMNFKKIHIYVLLKGCFITLGFAITTYLCVFLFAGINNSQIMTLSASVEQPQQTDQTGKRQKAVSETAPEIQNRVNSSVNILTEAAVKLGILSCVSRVNQVTAFLTANNQTGAFIFKPKSMPDQHIFSTSFELIRSDDSTLYASASFFPNQDAVYDTVEYVNKSCEEMEKTVFANLKRISVIKKNVIVLDGGAVKVFLMSAGSGTIVIKKEVIQ
jgi:hypothetical protein